MAASTNTIFVSAPNNMKISKFKLKKGQQVSKGTLVCLYTSGTDVIQKFKSNEFGNVAEILVKDGEEVGKGSVLFTVQGCSHPTVMKDMCADCGADLRIENSTAGNRKEEVSASVAMVHSIPELIVSEELAKELGKADEERLVKTRKLVLLVDLDQTLIHTTNDNIPANLKDVNHYQLWHGNQLLWYHTRLRPQTQTFLENISKLYELHICTFGSRIYAHTIAKILDPEGKFFSHRILSRDECFNAQSKTANLKALFPCGDAMVCIIDDREDVWHFSPNLVHVKPYRFFQGTADINAPPGLTKTEHDSETLVHRVRKVSQSSTDSNDEKSKECTKNETDQTTEDETEKSEGEKTKEGDDVKNEIETDVGKKEIEKDADKNQMEADVLKEDMETDVVEMKKENVDKNQMEADVLKEDIETDVIEMKKEIDKDTEYVKSKEEKESGIEKSIEDSKTCQETSNIHEKADVSGEEENKMETSEKKCELEDTETEKASYKSKTDAAKLDAGDGNKEAEKVETESKDENSEEVELIEWDDEDDYLFYLEEILKNIHSAFYNFYDQIKGKELEEIEDQENVEKPSLKNLIPYIKKKVLKGCNILFSGVIPTNMTAEKSRAYIVAKALGATIHTELKTKHNEEDPKEFTTHLVAARPGTSKVRSAVKYKHVKKVNPDWLWSCSERWERVEECLFPIPPASDTDSGRDSPDILKLQKDNVSKRKRKQESGNENEGLDSKRMRKVNSSNELENGSGKTEADEEDAEKEKRNFSMSYNPMLAFSDDDLAYMDKEVENEMDDEDLSSEDEEVRDSRIRKQVLKSVNTLEDSSSEDSLSGNTPRGWGLKKKMSPKSSSEDEMKVSNSPDHELGPEYESETDQDKFDKIMDAFGPETENSDDEYEESIGSVDEEIADAVMKEFLS